ncbi:MAG: hypothetical protein WDA20_11220 [Desulfuromonadales bacterium]
MEVIRGIRNIRSEMDINPGRQIPVVLDCRTADALSVVREGERYIRALARVDALHYGVGIDRPEKAATQVAGEVEILVPMAGLIDLAEEEKRLQREVAKVAKDVDLFEKKLSNEAFVAKAPAEVLEKDRSKLAHPAEKPGADSKPALAGGRRSFRI